MFLFLKTESKINGIKIQVQKKFGNEGDKNAHRGNLLCINLNFLLIWLRNDTKKNT